MRSCCWYSWLSRPSSPGQPSRCSADCSCAAHWFGEVVVGSALGARFAGTALHLIARTVLQAVGVTAILLSVTMIFAVGLHVGLGFDLRAIVLAFSPGGLAEMSLIALSLQMSVVYVTAHHVARILIAVTVVRLFAHRVAGD